MTKIYDQHRAAFNNVSAYVIADEKGNRLGNIAFKFPRDGAGRLYCYFHIFSYEMVRGYAGGYGYDKRSAAVLDAIQKFFADNPQEKNAIKLNKLSRLMGAGDWQNVLEREGGFQILQAV